MLEELMSRILLLLCCTLLGIEFLVLFKLILLTLADAAQFAGGLAVSLWDAIRHPGPATYTVYALAGIPVVYLLVRSVVWLCFELGERESVLPIYHRSGDYGTMGYVQSPVSPLARWRERRCVEERARAEERRRRWEQVEHCRRMEAKLAEAERRKAERRGRKREEERAQKREEERVRKWEEGSAEMSVAVAWTVYVRRWELIEQGTGPFTFGTISWPMLGIPSSTADLTLDAIALFFLSSAHSDSPPGRERISLSGLRSSWNE